MHPYSKSFEKGTRLWHCPSFVIKSKFTYLIFLPLVELVPRDFGDRDNGAELRKCEMGLIKINLTNPTQEVGMENSPAIWSRPLPLGWYFSEQWRRFEGPNWIQQKCDNWISGDRLLKNFANELPMVKCSYTYFPTF